ncbi:MAG: hypothetical protein IPJ33_08430 [Gammaproteobacteria bacterium]|nr:hypothetical protein [Gammaproteobacteria bacterium]MBP6052233.1 hypothetical protein [Pseudomonadales bacterium]MBK6581750.1 hypothetical protein [Gammaproteobacteria bacterium]MBK7520586.1 hypothetical protein [Gammaproteobacteria bacterium]MBK7728503.1 hypothetical protein [Gammaproteobacteria bacterium]
MTQTSNKGPGKEGNNPPARQLTSCGDVSCELLVDPIPRPTPDPIKVSLKPRVARVTFLDHHKPNSKVIMKYAQSILRDRGIEVRDEILIKDDASVRMPDALLRSLSGEGGLVLCGISD